MILAAAGLLRLAASVILWVVAWLLWAHSPLGRSLRGMISGKKSG